MQDTGSPLGYGDTHHNANSEGVGDDCMWLESDDDHAWRESDDDDEDDLEGQGDDDLATYSDDELESKMEDNVSLSDDGDDTSDDDQYIDRVGFGDPVGSREITMPTNGSGTNATN